MRPRSVLLFLALALALAACGSASAPGSTPTVRADPTPTPEIVIPAGQPIVIGMSVALTGDQQNIGKDIADAAELAIADRGATLQGHPLTAAREDDGCTDPEKAAGAAARLIANVGLAGVIGPMCTTGAQAADTLYEAAHVVHLSPSSTRTELSQEGERYFFRTAWRDDLQAGVQARYARETANAKTAYLIDDGEPYGKALADAFADRFGALGGTIASRERIARGAVDFTSLSKRVSAAAPDIVVFEGLNPEAALLVKQLRTDQVAATFMAGDGVFSQRDFIDTAASAADGALVSAGPQPDLTFIQRFQGRYQRLPGTAFVLEAYDAVNLLVGAIDATASVAPDGALHIDRARLADALRSRKALGLTGAITFDEHGDRVGSTPAEVGLVVYRVVNGHFEPAGG
jgi:branched-chain amino acid transport system substrate-binding protein